MFRSFGYILALAACLQLMGGHWAVLQVVAWTGMMVSFSSQGESISAALEKTFDGEHPCELCHKVKIGKAKEQTQDSKVALKQQVKAEFILWFALDLTPPGCSDIRRAHSEGTFSPATSLVPLHPPPRPLALV